MITPEFRKQTKEIFIKYRHLLGLPKSWKFRIVLNEKLIEYANVELDMDKKTYVINVNPKKNKQEIDLKDTIMHELIHVVLSPLTTYEDALLDMMKNKEKINFKQEKTKLDSLEEQIVIKLTNVLLKLNKDVK